MSMQIAGRGNNLGGPVAKISGAVVPPPAVTYILDTLALASSFAVSTRKVRAAYVGSCMRVRRSSDNLEADIGFNASGSLDTVALLAHTGVGSGFISKYYDQSGNGADLVQATTTVQPVIVSAGTVQTIATTANKPAPFTDGTTQYLTQGGSGGAIAMVQPFTLSSALQLVNVSVAGTILHSVTGAPNTQILLNVPNVLSSYAGSFAQIAAGLVANTKATVFVNFNGINSVNSYNGVASAVDTNVNGLTGIIFGTSASLANYTSVGLGELILFPSSVSPANRVILETSQKDWFGTP